MASESAAQGKKDYIMEHLLDSSELHLPFLHVEIPRFELFGVDVSITRHVVMMWIAAGFLLWVFIRTTRRRGLVPTGFANLLESVVVFIRDEVAVPNIGAKEAGRFSTLSLYRILLHPDLQSAGPRTLWRDRHR